MGCCESSCCYPDCPPGQQVVCLNGQTFCTQSGSCCGSSCSSSCGSPCAPSCAPSCAPCYGPCLPSYNIIYYRPLQYGYSCLPTMGCCPPLLSSQGCCVPKNCC